MKVFRIGMEWKNYAGYAVESVDIWCVFMNGTRGKKEVAGAEPRET